MTSFIMVLCVCLEIYVINKVPFNCFNKWSVLGKFCTLIGEFHHNRENELWEGLGQNGMKSPEFRKNESWNKILAKEKRLTYSKCRKKYPQAIPLQDYRDLLENSILLRQSSSFIAKIRDLFNKTHSIEKLFRFLLQ